MMSAGSKAPIWLVPAAFTVSWASVLAAPSSLKPLVAVLVSGALGAAVLLYQTFTSSVPTSRHARSIAIALAIGLAALFAGVVAGGAGLSSVLGVVGQHNGLLLWIVFALWFAIGARVGRGTPFRIVVWSAALLGAVAGLFAVLDAAHVLELVRYSPEVAGLMDSSISLGQVLVLSAGAAMSLVFVEKSPVARAAGIMAFLVILIALALSGARAAQISCVAGALVALLWVFGPRLNPGLARGLWAACGVALIAAVIGVLLVAAMGAPDNGLLQRVLTDRPTIWHSAWTHVGAHWLVGQGPDRFTAIVAWRPYSGWVEWQTTNSPHNVLLDWMLGGGTIALVAFSAAFVLAGRAIAHKVKGSSPGAVLLVAGIGAWAVSLLASWVDPISAVAAALLTGALLSEPPLARRPSSLSLAVGAIASVAVLAIVALGLPLLPLERGWAADQAAGTTSLLRAEERWQRWPDPAFAADALTGSLRGLPATAETAGRLATDVLTKTPWDTNGAIESLQVAAALDQVAPSTPHPSVEQALEVGRTADPAAGIWDEMQRILEK